MEAGQKERGCTDVVLANMSEARSHRSVGKVGKDGGKIDAAQGPAGGMTWECHIPAGFVKVR